MLLILRQSRWVLCIACMALSISQARSQTTPVRPASTPTSTSNPPTSAAPGVGQQHIQLMQLLEQIPPYRPTKEITGKANLSGSSTMYDLGHQWAMNFRQFHPKVELAGVADGSEAALSALAQDPSIIAGVSRQVDIDDQKKLQAGACKDPMAIIVATDAMALYVHKDNPIATLGVTPEQLQQIFSAGPDGQSAAKNWENWELQVPWHPSQSKFMGAKKGADRRPSLPKRS